MRILERYVFVELVKSFALTLLAITFVFFLGTAFRLTHERLTYWQIARILPYAVPLTMPYSVPLSFLIAIALTYGRLVADREVIALESLGIPPRALAPPAVAIACVLTVACLVLETAVLPWCHQRKSVIQQAVVEELLSLGEGEHWGATFAAAGFDIYVRTYRGPRLEGIVIHRDVQGHPTSITARRGDVALVQSGSGSSVVLELEDVTATTFVRTDGGRGYGDPVRVHADRFVQEVSRDVPIKVRTASYSSARLVQLLHEERDALRFAGSVGSLSGALAVLTDRTERIPAELAMRAANATAPIVFLLIGLPLTLALRHPNRLVPLVASVFAVSAFFFAPILLGRTLADRENAWPFWPFIADATGILGALACLPLGRRMRR